MYGYDAVLSALRAQAKLIAEAARGEAERAQLRRAYAEYVLRNKAKLILVRLQQTGDDAKRRSILREAFLHM